MDSFLPFYGRGTPTPFQLRTFRAAYRGHASLVVRYSAHLPGADAAGHSLSWLRNYARAYGDGEARFATIVEFKSCGNGFSFAFYISVGRKTVGTLYS